MPKNAPNLLIAHQGAYLNWVKWMLESFEFQMFTHDMWIIELSQLESIHSTEIGKPAGQIAVEFGGFFCERLVQIHVPTATVVDDDEEPAVQEPQSLPPDSQ